MQQNDQAQWSAILNLAASLAVALSGLTCNSGCAFIEPRTEFRINPITKTIGYSDGKNSKVVLKNAKYTSSNGFEIGELTVDQSASEVIDSNVAQMQAFVEQQRAANEGIQTTLAGLAEVAQALGVATANIARALPDATLKVNAGGVSGEAGITQRLPPDG